MKTEKRTVLCLTALCTITYFCSYLTRVNYAAVLVELISCEGFGKAAASAALTALFITYGLGQFVSGYLGDRMRPQKLILGGLVCSALMNLLIPFCKTTGQMTAVWAVNGLAQAMMWPPMVKILSGKLTAGHYEKAVLWVNCGGSFGAVAVYLCAPLLITLGSWRTVFYLSAALAAVMALAFLSGYGALDRKMAPVRQEAQVQGKKKMPKSRLLYGIFLLLMCAIVCQGMLRDGMTTWMPSFLAERFSLANTSSIFVSVALPLFSVASLQLSSLLNRRLIRNELACAGTLFSCAVGVLLLLRLCPLGVLPSAALYTLAACCMHGINLILISVLPMYFAKYGKASLVSGVLNSCTYLGSALSIYGVAVLIEARGWNATLTLWCGAAIVGLLCCLLAFWPWRRFKKNTET